jgi:hypothetical protein
VQRGVRAPCARHRHRSASRPLGVVNSSTGVRGRPRGRAEATPPSVDRSSALSSASASLTDLRPKTLCTRTIPRKWRPSSLIRPPAVAHHALDVDAELRLRTFRLARLPFERSCDC